MWDAAFGEGGEERAEDRFSGLRRDIDVGEMAAQFSEDSIADGVVRPHRAAEVAVFGFAEYDAGCLRLVEVGALLAVAAGESVAVVLDRMREAHVHGATPTGAVVEGFSQAARVVTAAAVIMVAVFSGFILSSETMFRELGFGLAAAVAIDAFVVRMTIVPAVMALLGRLAWWVPGWLDRLLPNIDVEGETLQQLEPTGPERPNIESLRC